MVLKSKTKKLFVKSTDMNGIQFTENYDEAKRYDGSWFANNEKPYLMFHFPEQADTLKDFCAASPDGNGDYEYFKDMTPEDED